MRELGLQDEFALSMAAGIGVAVYPIVDYNIPAKLPEFRDLVIKVVEQYLKKGKRVLVHCKHGKGRSGLFVAACLVYKGYNRLDAIKMTRKWIPNAM
jgi:protein-tyrosine phosphatase